MTRAARSAMARARYTLRGMGTPFTVGLVLLAILLVAGFAFDSDDKRRRSRQGRAGDADRHDRGAASRRSATCASVAAAARRRSARRRRKRDGLEDLDRNYPAARRHADEEVLKLLGLLEPGRRPAQGLGHDLRPGRGRLLRPAHEAPAGRQGAQTDEPGALRDHARPRAHARARGPALQARPRELELRRRRPRQPRAGRGLGDRGDVHLRRAPLHAGADARRPALEPRRRTPATCRRSSRRSSSSPTSQGQEFIKRLYETARRPLGAGRRAPTASARRPRPSRSCTPTSTCASSSPTACALHATPGAGWRRVRRRHLGRVGDRPAGRQRRRRGRLGRRPLRAVAARQRRLHARRAATATRSSCAGAGTTARRPAASRRRSTSGASASPARWPCGSRGLEVALALAPSQDLAERLVE